MGQQAGKEQESPVFSDEALRRFEKIVASYPERRAALMPVLWLAQEEFGWISPATQAYVAGLLELPLAWVEGVVSFYTMYRRRDMGCRLELCTNVSCRLKGAEKVLAAMARELGVEPGQTTRDGRFTLDRAECLGACELAPVLQVDAGPYVAKLDVPRALEIIGQLKRGESDG